jgi:hypothetical protein
MSTVAIDEFMSKPPRTGRRGFAYGRGARNGGLLGEPPEGALAERSRALHRRFLPPRAPPPELLVHHGTPPTS